MQIIRLCLKLPHNIIDKICTKGCSSPVDGSIPELMGQFTGPLVVLQRKLVSQPVRDRRVVGALHDLTYLGVLGVRWVIRVLGLLRDPCRIELLVSVHISRIDVLRWLAIRLLSRISAVVVRGLVLCSQEAGLELTASEEVRGHRMRIDIQAPP